MAGDAPVCTTPGPPTQSTFWPASLATRMPSATERTSTAWGFSLETSDSMKPKDPSSLVESGTVTLMPEAPQTIRIAHRTSDMGRVRTSVSAPPPVTSSPQSISGFSTGTQWPSRRT